MIAGRYTLEREVGRGGMGVVWLARDEVLGRLVAMKRVGMFPGGSDPDIERAAREARLAATLNHPHVVAVFDLVTDGAEQWLVMEYVDCVTLGGLVKRDGPLSLDRAARLVGQAAQALAAAHAAGIVHRDVKPANILVTAADQVKLTDFGIARAVADASLTQTGLVTGSPSYLAPEVASGSKATDASDTWSLGATLFHALAGRPPYEVTENPLGTLYKIINEDPPRLPDAGWLAPVLESTMATNPDGPLVDGTGPRRPRCGADLDAADDAADGRLPAGRCGGDDRTRTMQTEPEPDPVPTDPTLQADPPAQPPPAAPVRQRRRRVPPGLLAVVAAVVALALIVLIGWALLRGDSEQPAADQRGSGSETPSESPSPTKKKTEEVRPTAKGMTTFVEDYLATTTTNPAGELEDADPGVPGPERGLRLLPGFLGHHRVREPVRE